MYRWGNLDLDELHEMHGQSLDRNLRLPSSRSMLSSITLLRVLPVQHHLEQLWLSYTQRLGHYIEFHMITTTVLLACVSQWVKHLTLDCSSSHDLRVVRSSLMSDSTLGVEHV